MSSTLLLDVYCPTCDKLLSTVQRKQSHDARIHKGVAPTRTNLDSGQLIERFKNTSLVRKRVCMHCQLAYSSSKARQNHKCQELPVPTTKDVPIEDSTIEMSGSGRMTRSKAFKVVRFEEDHTHPRKRSRAVKAMDPEINSKTETDKEKTVENVEPKYRPASFKVVTQCFFDQCDLERSFK